MTVSVERDESTMSSYATYRTLWCTDQFQQRHWKLQKTPQRRSPQSCSKNAMNLWRKRILCIKNNLLLRHAIQAILRKIVVFLLTARTSSTQYEVVKPAMVAKAWQHQTGTLAKFTGQDFYQKKCTAHQERWTTFLRVPLHHYIKTCQIGSAGICLYGFLKLLGNWDTTDCGKRTWTLRLPSRALSNNRTIGFSAPLCCFQEPNQRSKRTIRNGTTGRWKKSRRTSVMQNLTRQKMCFSKSLPCTWPSRPTSWFLWYCFHRRWIEEQVNAPSQIRCRKAKGLKWQNKEWFCHTHRRVLWRNKWTKFQRPHQSLLYRGRRFQLLRARQQCCTFNLCNATSSSILPKLRLCTKTFFAPWKSKCLIANCV